MDTREIERILDECRVAMMANMERYDINASGRTANSFKVERYEGGVRLVSRGDNIAPFASLETGNEPSWVPINVLRQWVIEKRIEFNSEEERESFVRATQWKIAHEGTERYRQPNYDVTTPPIEQAVESLKSAITQGFVKQIHSILN